MAAGAEIAQYQPLIADDLNQSGVLAIGAIAPVDQAEQSVNFLQRSLGVARTAMSGAVEFAGSVGDKFSQIGDTISDTGTKIATIGNRITTRNALLTGLGSVALVGAIPAATQATTHAAKKYSTKTVHYPGLKETFLAPKSVVPNISNVYFLTFDSKKDLGKVKVRIIETNKADQVKQQILGYSATTTVTASKDKTIKPWVIIPPTEVMAISSSDSAADSTSSRQAVASSNPGTAKLTVQLLKGTKIIDSESHMQKFAYKVRK